jgi:hypothetical protein
MSIETILNDAVNSYLLFIPGTYTEIFVAAPHHAPLSVETLPCESHPSSDENTGLIAFHLARLLGCPCLIAGNYFLDSNKHKGSDYFKKIESLKPKILIEIHGHGSLTAKFDIEISSGSLDKSSWSEKMAAQLQQEMDSIPALRNYSLSGEFNRIYFKASKSLTINTNLWMAFHIELPQKLRETKSEYMPFCELLEKVAVDMI